MKILLVLDVFSTRGGGVSTVVFKLAEVLAQRGHKVTVLTTDVFYDANYAIPLEKLGVEVVVLKKLFTIGGLVVCPSAISFVKKRLREFDVVHSHIFTSFLGALVAYYAKKLGVPMILDCHGNLPGTDDKKRKVLFHRYVGRKVFDWVTFFVAETKKGADEYVALGAPESKVIIQHPGFDVDEMSVFPAKGGFRTKYGIAANKKIIFFLGRIHEIKGLEFLVQGFAELRKRRSDVLLVIAGPDDGYLSQLKEKISELNIEKDVQLIGYLDLNGKKEALSDVEVFAQPSKYEQGIAHTTIEALLAGLPVLATEGNGAAEDLNKMKAGFMVNYGDTQAFCSTMDLLLDQPQAAQEKVTAGRNYIHNHLSLKSTVQSFEKLFHRSLELQ